MPEFDIAAMPSATKPTLADDDCQLTPAEASELVGLSINTLRDYRSTRGRRFGPPFHMRDRKIVYRLSELLDWMDSKATQHREQFDD
ncbi:helix-turn-helix domain-containing protein [Sulfitobacter sp.]|uniref:helix-turn-helix domain-containing protein n=1 Tax=Sulfitobacter sp. TaxID=1903071 RepID=UPI003001E5AE